MMKFMFFMIFLMPLSFLSSFWMVQVFFFILTFMFFVNFSFDYMFMNISYYFGSDLLSYMLILLSFWICSLMIMASEMIFKLNNYFQLFLIVMVFLMFSLFMTFSSLNLFLFYLFFEMSLILTLMLIIGWGYQPERIEAGVYLMFYTLFVSLPMMITIFFCYKIFYSLNFYFLSNLNNLMVYLCMNFAFFIKLPMFFLHLWLPKAHVEAPVAGSMILAGIMLKLGGYGLMRLMKMFVELGLKINIVFLIVSLVGGFYVSLICIRQSDMKSLIAYSSVAHMGLVLGGIMSMNLWGMSGSLAMMLAHGLCSSGLFCLANISYERVGSRSLYLNKGLMNIMPNMSLYWFLFSCSNMAAPPFLNLLGEIMLINSLMGFNSLSWLFLILMMFLSAVYSLFLYSYTQHGTFYSGLNMFYSGVVREYLLLFLHLLPLGVLILKSEYLIYWI
uniref:NADH-ubiquinone oxidoreductase chain 4 n=1 Tax=Palaestes abruptus TaxID=2528286 RepID=A0A7G7MUA4_9CUCU|nr:NADH dehydrogenase subunit 4 [Palaestes abruptus]QNG56283.1 NADH dehydrogenase subunit 4 [Palaestes abruptus]QNG56413.1 NADH dehydrogenase subunit 4 [Palaestes abruptus]